jgi:esterase/lipase superfamily enzyme/TRAP-type C4-dicarboxylate transport system substrate-binding protein
MWQRLIAIIIFSLVCGVARAADPIILRFGYPAAVLALPNGRFADRFADEVNRQIAGVGRLDVVRSIRSNTLVDLREGLVDFAVVPVPQLAGLRNGGFSLFSVPFLFDNLPDVASFQQGAIGDAALASLDQIGLVGLGYWNFGTERLFGRTIRDADSLKGITIGVPSVQLGVSLDALGARTVPLAIEQRSVAVTQGAIDAAVLPPSFIASAQLYQKSGQSLTAEPVVPLTYLIVANQAKWNSIPYQIQAALAREAETIGTELNATTREQEGGVVAALRERGVQVVSLSTENIQAIRTRVTSGAAAHGIESDRLAALGLRVIDQNHRHPLSPDRNLDQAPPPNGRVALFFATDRKAQSATDPSLEFGSQRGPLTYGTMKVDLGPNRPAAGATAQARIIDLKTFSGESDFSQALARSMAASDRKQLLIYVHGYNNTFEDAAESAASLMSDLKFKGVGLVFSWPSDGEALQYSHDESEEAASHQTFVTVLQAIRATGAVPSIDVVAHSMGNRIVTSALELLAANPNERKPILHQLILAAPDVYQARFVQLIDAMSRLSDRVTLYASSADQALICSGLLHQGPRAGQAGSDLIVHAGLDTIDVSNSENTSFFETVAENLPGVEIYYWLLSKACRKGHSYVTREFPVVNDLYSLVTFDIPPDGRVLLEKRAVQNLWYWEMRRVAQ